MTELLLRNVDQTAPLISEFTFRVLIWVFLAIGIIAFFIRISIRLFCVRQLLVEDYFMFFSLVTYIASAAVQHTYLSTIYAWYRVSKGFDPPTADIARQTTTSLHSYGVVLIVTISGVWAIKLNYLFFFRRLTRQIRVYILIWRVVLGLFIICWIVNIGIIPYQCMFGNFITVVTECATDPVVRSSIIITKTGVGLDIATDLILIAFPIMILWPTKIRLTQKILLSGVFSFTLVTIGVTVVRGSVFGTQFYRSIDQVTSKVLDFIWILFWYWVEFGIALIIASLVSFRSLFTSREQKHRDERYKKNIHGSPGHGQLTIGGSGAKSSGLCQSDASSKKKPDKFFDSLLETVRDWDGLEADAERGDYVNLVGITKTVDLSQRTSHAPPDLGAGRGSRASQTALAAYCYYEESAKALQGTTVVNLVEPARPVARGSERVHVVDVARPEPAGARGATVAKDDSARAETCPAGSSEGGLARKEEVSPGVPADVGRAI